MVLEPAIDVYGRYARASALADFVELWALAGDNVSPEELTDYASDNNWGRKLSARFKTLEATAEDEDEDEDEGDEESGDDDDAPATGSSSGQRVFDHLSERATTLGDHYPFALEKNRLVYKGGGEAYLALLAITIAHAHELEADEEPTVVFPRLVARLVSRRVGHGVNFADVRGDLAFPESIVEAGTRVGLSPAPAGTYKTYANDEGLDFLGSLSWLDQREGHWVCVGQVTCGESGTWRKKLDEVSIPNWVRFLSLLMDPSGFLAVPHHVERDHFTYLVQSTKKSVLDRLRLVPFLEALAPEEQSLLDLVREAQLATR